MSKSLELYGKTFGKLCVIGRAENSRDGATRWLCECECGNKKIVTGILLKNGNTKSCGCAQYHSTHGGSKTRLYRTWHHMLERCKDARNCSYQNYGGRGISVCLEWMQFEPFRDWALSNGYSDTLTIDRIDVNGNYCPENCRWATYEQQNNNLRRNHVVVLDGRRRTISQLSREYSINKETLRHRINSGVPPKSAVRRDV